MRQIPGQQAAQRAAHQEEIGTGIRQGWLQMWRATYDRKGFSSSSRPDIMGAFLLRTDGGGSFRRNRTSLSPLLVVLGCDNLCVALIVSSPLEQGPFCSPFHSVGDFSISVGAALELFFVSIRFMQFAAFHLPRSACSVTIREKGACRSSAGVSPPSTCLNPRANKQPACVWQEWSASSPASSGFFTGSPSDTSSAECDPGHSSSLALPHYSWGG